MEDRSELAEGIGEAHRRNTQYTLRIIQLILHF